MTNLDDQINKDLEDARIKVFNNHLDVDPNETPGERLTRIAGLIAQIIRNDCHAKRATDYQGPERRRSFTAPEDHREEQGA